MAKQIRIDMSQFSGGRNGEDDPTDLVDGNGRPNGQGAEQINIRTAKNAIQNKPGEAKLGTEINSTDPIVGLGTWGNNLVSVHDTTLYMYSDDWYPIKTGLTTDTPMSFLEYYNDMYCSNGVDTVFRSVKTQLNGALSGAETTITVDDASKFVEVASTTVSADVVQTAFIADGTALTGDSFTYLGASTPPIVNKVFGDSPFTTTAVENTINYDATGGNSIVNLITSVGNTDKIYIIRKTDATANTVTINANGAETIDGGASAVLSNQGDFILIRSDGAVWLSTTLIFASATVLDNVTGVLAHADDSIVVTSFDIDDAPKGRALEEYAEKFWLGNITESLAIPSDPWREYYSVTATASSPDQFYDFSSSGSGQEFLAEGGEITATLAYRDNLLIGKTTGIKYVNGFDDATPPVPIMYDFFKNDGPVNEDSMIQVGADVVYFTGSRFQRLFVSDFEGIQQAEGFDRPVLDLLENIDTDQSEAALSFNPKSGLMFASVKTKGAPQNDLRIVYSTKTGAWWQEQNVFARKYTVLNGVTYYGHSITGKIIQDDTGFTRDGASDLTRYESRHEKPRSSRRFDWRHLYLDGLISPNTIITVKIYIDNKLLNTATITIDDIRDVDAPSEAYGDETIGDTMWGGGVPGEPTVDPVRPFEKWIPAGRHGKEFFYTLETTGLAQQYVIDTAVAYTTSDNIPFRLQSSN